MDTIYANSFCFGTFYGFVAAGVIGLILNQLRMQRVQMGHRHRSLDNFPDSAHPNMTPSGLVSGSWEATLRFSMWVILLIVFSGLMMAGLYYIVA